ncbi:MAG: MBL fold metallo-hydrolase [Gammaproteobacteria bacterium]|nr:MAG: MBL fold metallo-hydrolase [Gammaproteobacteria bacterium]
MARLLDYEHGISAIDAHYQRPGLAALYLIVEGDRVAFIDTGTSRSVPDALDVLRQKGLAPPNVAYVIPTHVHLDHAGGAGELMRRCPNARLVAHPKGARHLIYPTKLIAGVTAVYGPEAVARDFGEIVPIEAARVIEAPDDFTLDLNGRTLRFFDTPGHARHHFCVWDERSRGLFTGDTFGLSYRELDTDKGPFVFPTTTPVQFEPEALHASIDRLLQLHPQYLYLTHFGRIAQVERAAEQMHELIDAFVVMAKTGRDVENRHARLIQGQRDILLPRLRAHGCRLSDAKLDTLLALDYELNAQGIEVWLDRAAMKMGN